MNTPTKKCKICKKVYYKDPNTSKKTWNELRKYCSKSCQHKSLIGHIPANKGKPLGFIPKMAFKPGNIPWSKGKKGILPSGERHGMWKGDKVGYSGLHYWVSRWKGRPKKCEQCGTIKAKRYEWANIDHKYSRVLDDYIRMCTPCHRKYDRDILKIKIR